MRGQLKRWRSGHQQQLRENWRLIASLRSVLYSQHCLPHLGPYCITLQLGHSPMFLAFSKETVISVADLPFFKFNIFFQLLFNYSCPHPPPLFSSALSTPLPTFSPPTPIVFVHGFFIHVSWLTFPFFPPLFPSPLPSAYCQFVLYFHVSGSILLACFFVVVVD